jgi:hypothetical protein
MRSRVHGAIVSTEELDHHAQVQPAADRQDALGLIAQALDRMLEPIQVEAAKLEVALPPIVQGRRRWE